MKNILSKENFNGYKPKYPIRNIWKMKWKNDGFRSLYESIIYPEVKNALDDWKNNDDSNCVLIGGVALSYYIKPRPTEDLDLIFLSYKDIPNQVYKFKKSRKHAFKHIKTHVEVELLTPEHLKEDPALFQKVFDTAIESDGIKVASPLSLIALKLGRFNKKDQLDINNLYEYCLENDLDTDLTPYNLDKERLDRFYKIVQGLDEYVSSKYLLETNSLFNSNTKYLKINTDMPYDIYIFEEKYGEPRFHFSSDIKRQVKRFKDFQFAISLTETFKKDNSLKVIESTTGYNSLNSFRKEEKELKEWLLKDNNLKMIRNKWQKLNNRGLKSKYRTMSKKRYRKGLLHHNYRFGLIGNLKVWFCRNFGHRLNNDVKHKWCEICGMYYGEIYHKQEDYIDHI